MNEQLKFQTALAALNASAQQNNRKLSKEEVLDFFQDMELDRGQQEHVFRYLASKGIQVDGIPMPQIEVSPVYDTDEEKEFLNQYRKKLKSRKRQTENEVSKLFTRAASGEEEAKKLLAENYMERVLELALGYAHQGLFIQDLVQEGNLGLLIGIQSLDCLEEGISFETHLENEIHRAIRTALQEQAGERNAREQITEKLNQLADAAADLKEEYGRDATPEELSIYLNTTLSEIEDLLWIAGDSLNQ